MSRSAGVTVAAVFSLLGSVAILLMGCLMVFVAVFARSSTTVPEQPAAAVMVASSLMFLLPAAWGIATSIGLFRLKKWARISILVFACLLTVMGLSAPLAFFAIRMPPVPNQAPQIWASVRAAMVVVYLSLAGIGIWWLVFFTRGSVKKQFYGELEASASARPLSISIIACLLIFGSVGTLAMALFHFPAAFLNKLLTGWAAIVLYLAFAGASMYLGIGLLRLNPRARVLALYYSVFAAANGALFYALPGADHRYSAMVAAMPFFRLRSSEQMRINPWFSIVFSSLFMLVQIYFLVTRKSAFERSSAPAAAGNATGNQSFPGNAL